MICLRDLLSTQKVVTSFEQIGIFKFPSGFQPLEAHGILVSVLVSGRSKTPQSPAEAGADIPEGGAPFNLIFVSIWFPTVRKLLTTQKLVQTSRKA